MKRKRVFQVSAVIIIIFVVIYSSIVIFGKEDKGAMSYFTENDEVEAGSFTIDSGMKIIKLKLDTLSGKMRGNDDEWALTELDIMKNDANFIGMENKGEIVIGIYNEVNELVKEFTVTPGDAFNTTFSIKDGGNYNIYVKSNGFVGFFELKYNIYKLY